MKQDKRNKRGAYTTEQKIEAVRLLKDNSFNLYLTSHQTGISTSSLRSWSTLYSKQMESDNKVAIIAESVELNLARAKTNFINKHYSKMSELAEESIKRALDLVKTEKDLNKVNGTIKVISDFFGKATGEGEEDGSGKSNNITLIEQTILQLYAAKG